MAGLLSGLEQFGLSNLEVWISMRRRKAGRRRGRWSGGCARCAGAGFPL